MWLTNNVYKSSCFINVQYFPFDIQNCSLTFASWTYDREKIDIFLINHQADVSNYLENNEWELVQIDTIRHLVKYSCCTTE